MAATSLVPPPALCEDPLQLDAMSMSQHPSKYSFGHHWSTATQGLDEYLSMFDGYWKKYPRTRSLHITVVYAAKGSDIRQLTSHPFAVLSAARSSHTPSGFAISYLKNSRKHAGRPSTKSIADVFSSIQQLKEYVTAPSRAVIIQYRLPKDSHPFCWPSLFTIETYTWFVHKNYTDLGSTHECMGAMYVRYLEITKGRSFSWDELRMLAGARREAADDILDMPADMLRHAFAPLHPGVIIFKAPKSDWSLEEACQDACTLFGADTYAEALNAGNVSIMTSK